MQVLPEGFALPPAPYLFVLLVCLLTVGAGLVRRRPAVSERLVLAFAPWMVVGSALHVLYVVDALPPIVRPLGGTVAVYATVAAGGGAVWLAADATSGRERTRAATESDGRGEIGTGRDEATRRSAAAVAAAGALAITLAVAAVLAVGAARGTLAVAVPAAGFAVAAAAAAASWAILQRLVPAVRLTGAVGALAVFGHALDGVSTAIGVDILGFGERTPLSRSVIEFAAGLPTAEFIGAGWLFILVKLVVAGVVVTLLADYVREDPREGYLVLGFVAAVGLGPGAHNLLLFAVA